MRRANHSTRRELRARFAVHVSPYVRHYSAEEIRAIADRIRLLVEQNRTIRLTPATGWLVEQALLAHTVQPSRLQIMAIICGAKNCPRKRDCATCMGKANVIMRLYDGEDIGPMELPESRKT